MPPFALECRGVRVAYGAVTALRDISLGFAPGLIHAVVGQNGAGKTSFARIAAGLVRPAEGSLAVAGQPVATGSVNAARAAGIALVHQSFALPPSFTVAEAMEFGAPGRRALPYARAALEARWRPHLESLGLGTVPLRARVRDLPVEVRQGVEIARALVTRARVLILDEPTAVLAPAGIATLFRRLATLRQGGVTVILILHKIREVLEIADTVTVLRGGRHVAGPLPAAEIGAADLAAAIIGTAAPEAAAPGGTDRAALVGAPAQVAAPAPTPPAGPALLTLAGVSTRDDAGGPKLDRLSLAVQGGEIVGVAGVEGNGQVALLRACAGLATITAGSLRLGDAEVTHAPPLARRAAGLSIIPFERNSEGLSLSSPLWENWAARQLLLARRMLAPIRPARLRAACGASLRQWDVRFAGPDQPAGALSGGNAQKVILAREIDAAARVVIAAQPTRGLDIGATAFVWQALRDLRRRGCGVLLISSDLDELFDISDRVLVMLSGRIAGSFAPPFRRDAVGRAMTGVAA
jgi:ABC-type uncharacterized transport system ATPase subunit